MAETRNPTMVEPSPPTETVVARVRTDAATAVRIQNGVAESWAGHVAAVAIAEEVDGHWSVAVHFGVEPDESAVRALIASLGGKALATELIFETLPPTDWVRRSLEGLRPVMAGRVLLLRPPHRCAIRG